MRPFEDVATSMADALQGALALHTAGDHAAACAALESMVRQAPAFAPARNALGVVLLDAGRVDEAIQVLEPLARTAPRVVSVQVNLGNALAQARQFPQAIAAFQRAAALEPHAASTHYGLARVLQLAGEPAAAVASYRQSLQRDANQVEAWANLAAALNFLDQHVDGASAARRALALDAMHAGAHFNLAVALLSRGEWADGWAEFEWRSRTTLLQGCTAPSSAPAWDGVAHAGDTLLVWAEQGFGDTLQFVRWLAPIRSRGMRVVLMCQRPLVRLLHASRVADAVMPLGAPPPAHQAQVSLSSLAHRLRLHDAAALCAPSTPYLHRATPTGRRASGAPLRVGLVWAGHPTHVNDRHRSIGLAALQPLFELPAITWVRLQAGPRAAEHEAFGTAFSLHEGIGPRSDFLETARVLESLDLVLTVDSAVAHLAGAMGVPTWLLLPRVGLDWRWMVGGAPTPFGRSPWYDCVRYVRQDRAGEWSATIAAVRRALADRLTAPTALLPAR